MALTKGLNTAMAQLGRGGNKFILKNKGLTVFAFEKIVAQMIANSKKDHSKFLRELDQKQGKT